MYTAFDAIEYLMSSTGGGAQDREHRVLRQALFHAYRDLIAVRDWKYYHADDTVNLSSSSLVTTYRLPWGVSSVDALYLPNLRITAEYVNQSDWTRIENSPLQQLVRLAWTVVPSPENTGYYDLKVYNGYRYNEGVTLTYRRRPRDLRLTGWEPNSRVGTITTASAPTRAYATASRTGTSVSSVTVTAGGFGYTSAPKVTFIASPGSGATASAVISAGRVSSINVTNGGSGYAIDPLVDIEAPTYTPPGSYFSVTGTGTSFGSPMAGAVLRASGDAVHTPEGLAGMRPYVFEGLIVGSPSSTTAMNVYSPDGTSTLTGSKYVITDILDLSPGMYTSLLSGAEMWIARLTGKNVDPLAAIYARDMRLAFEQDTMAPESGRRFSAGGYFSFWYLRAGVDQPATP